jgi:hypothetical protein
MKLHLLLILIAFTINSFGQDAPGRKPVKTTTFSKITVSYQKADVIDNHVGQPKYYVNNTFYGNGTPIFNEETIENINIEKEGSKILITLKSENQPNFITMDQLKKKYVDSKSKAAIYIVEGNLINDPLQLIDENYVLNIKVSGSSDLPYLKNHINGVDIISVSLKSKANLDKANRIYIRGNNEQGK